MRICERNSYVETMISERVHANLPMGKIGWRSSWRAVSRERDPRLEQGKGKGLRSSSSGEEGAAETKCHEVTASLFSYPLTMLGTEVEKSGVKLSLGRRER